MSDGRLRSWWRIKTDGTLLRCYEYPRLTVGMVGSVHVNLARYPKHLVQVTEKTVVIEEPFKIEWSARP